MLIIGYRVSQHVMDLRSAVIVTYTTSDGRRYEREYTAQVVTCPPSIPENQCDRPAEEKFGPLP